MSKLKETLFQFWQNIGESWRYAIAAFLLLRLLYAGWSWIVFTVQPVAVQNFEFAGEPIVSIFKLSDSQAYTFSREVNGNVLTFAPADANHLTDRQTGSLWNISNGTAVQGEYKGVSLRPAKTSPSRLFPYHGAAPYSGMWLALWQRFDANWYISIAERGYGSIPGDIHFPPLFPLLMRTLRPLFGSSFLAGLFIAHLGTLFALKLLYKTFLGWGEKETGRRAFLFFAMFPTFFFLFSAYTEPLFLVAAILAFKAMQKRSWLWAGFWVFCAILTRLQGVALLAPMLFLMWRDRPFLGRLSHWAGLLISGIAGLTYLYLRSMTTQQSALPFVEADLHARLVFPWQSYAGAVKTIFAGNASFVDFLNWAITTLFLVFLIAGWKKIPCEYSLFTAISLMVILSRVVETQPLVSMSRYALTLFPSFYILSLAGKQPLLRRAIIYLSLLLNLYLSGQFFLWGWVA
jgi:hypothetical protein